SEKKRALSAGDRRFVLVSDLGIVVKDAVDGSHDVFVQNIASGRPVAQARVEILGKNGLAVLSTDTDETGKAHFPTLKDFKREKEPVVWIVKKNDDLSFLPVGRADRRLNFSRFDVGG